MPFHSPRLQKIRMREDLMKSERQGLFILGCLGSRTLLNKLVENMNAHRLNRIALVSVFGLALALPQAARGQTLAAAAEDIGGDSEVVRLADDTEAYDALRRVSARLYARGEAGRALQLREELGDLALSNGDAGVAAHAYVDAAWIARELAQLADSRARRTLWLNWDADVRWFVAEVERLLGKAEGAIVSADLSDQQLAGIHHRLGKTPTVD
jgi:hypothetical protein